jgi:hypothetical protein
MPKMNITSAQITSYHSPVTIYHYAKQTQTKPIYREFFDMIFIKKKAPAPRAQGPYSERNLYGPHKFSSPRNTNEGSFTFCRLPPAVLLSQACDTTRIIGQLLLKRN